MIAHPRTHNELISVSLALLEREDFSSYELAQIFSGAHDQPIQLAVRNLETGRVYLLDLNRDATLDTASLPA
jgi:hypothetical protein